MSLFQKNILKMIDKKIADIKNFLEKDKTH
jgi:hypothetical protein